MSFKVLILGANGFIGSHLTSHILQHTDWQVIGLDLTQHKLTEHLQHPRLHFKQGDLHAEHTWIEQQLQQADVVLPLVAVANPAIYVKDPLYVFELDFEANLAIVKLCVKHNKRIIFPSTSEVYGMCPDDEFDEYTSPLVLGPTSKPRWIYSCCKQMLDRVITAHGDRDGLHYTLFRPFNWIGPKLDNILDSKAGSSRAFSQFIGNILRSEPIKLVNGGNQRRSFTYIDDAILALMEIIKNPQQRAAQQIFNIGNPNNDVSMRQLVDLLKQEIAKYPRYAQNVAQTEIITVSGEEYFGKGYQDANARVPSITHIKQQLNWSPTTDLTTAIRKTLVYYLGDSTTA